MKIAMPVSEKSIDSYINNTFGRANYFLIYDTESESSVFIDNTAAASQGGAGISAAQILVDQNIDSLITPRCGKNSAEVFENSNIKLYRSIAGAIKENIELLKEGKLNELTEIHAGFHGVGRNNNRGRGRR
ncbi:NifB/NifX family molybdenum-iron cluster-binding protein [Senegalia massiliensis]|uniref:Dinitrogenase iron-molybdenum cofactor biosynthesis protein n=1 Tax=Senegalia massiliensis TaxID=1720316 RepID=A0A845R339_9CLOT|nr:NifB/NifX family molybdenum-iron cluster-binding protein [Senegalia massiliensis]NBI07998.1 dinitrogenase iron-molybdenum cofactor biosynthesis protein [Senegalia massiliensis]